MNASGKHIINNLSPKEKLKKILSDKEAIHKAIRKGESLQSLKDQGIRFVTPI